MFQLVLLRHGQATKNLEYRHGGLGTALTERGKDQVQRFSSLARRYFPSADSISYVHKPQCEETARIVSYSTSWTLSQLERVIPFNLGILDGLSDIEATERHPVEARMMNEWRLGLIDISQVNIPNATNFVSFYKSGKEALTEIVSRSSHSILIGTRSIMVLMWNVLKGHTPTPDGCYYERPWDNCEWVEFVSNDSIHWKDIRTQRDTESHDLSARN